MAATQKTIAETAQNRTSQWVLAVVAGLFLFIAVVKYGDPVILDKLVQPPENIEAAVFQSWPLQWGYWLTLPLIVVGLAAIGRAGLDFKWPLALPLVWLVWQFISATKTVNPELTAMTLKHFSVCVLLFYLGCLGLKGMRNPWPVWAGLALGFCWVLRAGIEQQFGGLDETRLMFFTLKGGVCFDPRLLHDPEYLKRIASPRIFSTFSNPDAFAGSIVLLLPLTLAFIWQITPKRLPAMRWVFPGIIGGCGLACLYWSGSKAGWLVGLIVAMAALGHSTLPMKWRRILIWAVVGIGVAALGLRYAHSFQKQKVSVTTRSVYWRAAVQIAARHPLFGTGPGTYSVSYGQTQHSGAGFTRLCHNDYLEQACDSGLPGFVVYAAMMFGYLAWLYRYRARGSRPLSYAVVLGLVGLCLHSVVEYHLYIPALAWPMFFLLGWAMKNDN
jgi:O-antigen ligase